MGINYSEIGKAIKSFRIKEEITQDQLSEYAGISPGYLSKIEGGFAKPSLDTLFSIADSLGVSLNDLVYSNNDLDQYEMSIKMVSDTLQECSATEKELVYSLLKSFVDFLTERGIRL